MQEALGKFEYQATIPILDVLRRSIRPWHGWFSYKNAPRWVNSCEDLANLMKYMNELTDRRCREIYKEKYHYFIRDYTLRAFPPAFFEDIIKKEMTLKAKILKGVPQKEITITYAEYKQMVFRALTIFTLKYSAEVFKFLTSRKNYEPFSKITDQYVWQSVDQSSSKTHHLSAEKQFSEIIEKFFGLPEAALISGNLSIESKENQTQANVIHRDKVQVTTKARPTHDKFYNAIQNNLPKYIYHILLDLQIPDDISKLIQYYDFVMGDESTLRTFSQFGTHQTLRELQQILLWRNYVPKQQKSKICRSLEKLLVIKYLYLFCSASLQPDALYQVNKTPLVNSGVFSAVPNQYLHTEGFEQKADIQLPTMLVCQVTSQAKDIIHKYVVLQRYCFYAKEYHVKTYYPFGVLACKWPVFKHLTALIDFDLFGMLKEMYKNDHFMAMYFDPNQIWQHLTDKAEQKIRVLESAHEEAKRAIDRYEQRVQKLEQEAQAQKRELLDNQIIAALAIAKLNIQSSVQYISQQILIPERRKFFCLKMHTILKGLKNKSEQDLTIEQKMYLAARSQLKEKFYSFQEEQSVQPKISQNNLQIQEQSKLQTVNEKSLSIGFHEHKSKKKPSKNRVELQELEAEISLKVQLPRKSKDRE